MSAEKKSCGKTEGSRGLESVPVPACTSQRPTLKSQFFVISITASTRFALIFVMVLSLGVCCGIV